MKRTKSFKYLLVLAAFLFFLFIYFKFNIVITPRNHSIDNKLQLAANAASHSAFSSQKKQKSQDDDKILVYKKEDVALLIEKHLKPLIDNNQKSGTQPDKVNVEPKKEIKYSYLNKYPRMLDCNDHGVLNKWSPTDLNTFKPTDYAQASANSTNEKRFLRGVLVYFPIEKANEFSGEFKWLYRSWIEMIRVEPVKWRTDLIVFLDKEDKLFNNEKFFLNELNCSFSNKRTGEMDKPMCILIQYKPIAQRDYKQLTNSIFWNENDKEKKLKFDYLLDKVNIFNSNEDNLLPFYTLIRNNLRDYGYTDSILMAFDGYEYFKSAGYDFLIRSDMDVFLTPLLAKWLPKNCNDFIVGGGAYSENFNRKRLKRIALDLGMEHAGGDNLGSTWISTPEQFRIVSYLTLFGMMYISKEEFSQPEKQGKVSLWPYWHYGVLLLYGQNIGMNHLIGSKHLNIVKLNNMIDYPSGNTEKITEKLHIHVYHGEEMFSKFMFKSGKYDNLSMPVENLDQVKTFCLKMALESKRLNVTDLFKLLTGETIRKN